MRMWELLKEYNFEDRTVRLYRSNVTLRKWQNETIFKTGQTQTEEHESEGVAWSIFCSECMEAIHAMEVRHCDLLEETGR